MGTHRRPHLGRTFLSVRRSRENGPFCALVGHGSAPEEENREDPLARVLFSDRMAQRYRRA